MLIKKFVVVYLLFSGFGVEKSWANCRSLAQRFLASLGMSGKKQFVPSVRFEDEKLHSFVVPVIAGTGWVPPGLLGVEGFVQAEKILSKVRKSPRVIALFEIPLEERKGDLKRLPSFTIGNRHATNLEIFEKYLFKLSTRYSGFFANLESKFEVSRVKILATYLKYAKSPLGAIQGQIDSHANLFQSYGLSAVQSLEMAIALGHVETKDLQELVPKLTKIFNSKVLVASGVEETPFETITEADFILSYGARFGSLPIREIDEVASAVHVAAYSVQRGPLNFLEVISRIDTRLREVLFRIGLPSVNENFSKVDPDYEHSMLLSPWKAFRERVAWSFADRKIVNEQAISKIKNIFILDQIYTLIAEYYERGLLILTDDYQKDAFIGNLITFGLCDFILGWTGVQTATQAFQKSKVWKDAKSQFLANRYKELKQTDSLLTWWKAFKEFKKDKIKRRLEDYPYPAEFSEQNGTVYENLAAMKFYFDNDLWLFVRTLPDFTAREFRRQWELAPYYAYASGAWLWDFASRGKSLAVQGGTATFVGISGLQLFLAGVYPDPTIEPEDRIITVLWKSFLVSTWMATSSNIRYSLVLKNLQQYWERKFPTIKRGLSPEVVAQNQKKQLLRTRVAGGANALVGGVTFISLWQSPLDQWFNKEGGGHDQAEAFWEELVEEILPEEDRK